MKRLLTASFLATLLLMAGIAKQAKAQPEIDKPDIRVSVDGLTCPFCAYGIEKKLKKIKSIDKLYVNIEEGTVDLKLKKEATLSEKEIEKAVADAGFEVRSIEYINRAVKPNDTSEGA